MVTIGMRVRNFVFFASLFLLLAGCAQEDSKEPLDVLESSGLIERIHDAREYDPEVVLILNRLMGTAADREAQAVLKYLLIGLKELPGSPVEGGEVRAMLENLSEEHSGTWVSVFSKLKIAGIHLSIDSHQEKIDILESVLIDPGLADVGDPGKNPLLRLFPADEESKAIADNPQDLIRFLLVSEHARGFDLTSAEAAAGEIKSEFWLAQAASPLEYLRSLEPDVLETLRERFVQARE